jgi:hypothetical protein
MGGWVEVKAVLRIAYSNQKHILAMFFVFLFFNVLTAMVNI